MFKFIFKDFFDFFFKKMPENVLYDRKTVL